MFKKQFSHKELSILILDVIKNRKPETIDQLLRFVEEIYDVSSEEVLFSLNALEEEGMIKLTDLEHKKSVFKSMVISPTINLCWLAIALSVLDLFFILILGANINKQIYHILINILILSISIYGTFSFFSDKAQKEFAEKKLLFFLLSVSIGLVLAPLFSLILPYFILGPNLFLNVFFDLFFISFFTAVILRDIFLKKSLQLKRLRKNRAYFES